MSPAFWAFVSGAITGFFAAFWLFIWLWGRMVPKELHEGELKRLNDECFALSADMCHHGYGDDYGNHRCKYQDKIEELQARLNTQEGCQHGRV